MADRMCTIKVNGFTPGGYGVQVEIEGVSLNKLGVSIDWLDTELTVLGIKGVVLSEADCQAHLDAPKESKECPIHHVPMVKHTKGRGSWYSHKLDDGTWCRGATDEG